MWCQLHRFCLLSGQFHDRSAALGRRRTPAFPICPQVPCWLCSSWSRIIGAVSGELLPDLGKAALAEIGDYSYTETVPLEVIVP
jgi:hypothetical protein